MDEHAQGFQDRYRAAAVVVGAGGGEERREIQVDAVLVGANHNRLVAFARDRGDDGGLAPGVRKRLDGRVDSARIRKRLVDLAEEPRRALGAVVRLVVARVERGKCLEVCAHILLLQLLEQRRNSLFVRGLLGELDARCRRLAVDRPEFLVVRNVEEVDVLLVTLSTVLD